MRDIYCQGQHPRQEGLCRKKLGRSAKNIRITFYEHEPPKANEGMLLYCPRCRCCNHVTEVMEKTLAA